MFSATSYFWPLLIGLVLFGGVLLIAVVAVGFAAFRKTATTTTPTAPSVPAAEPHLAAKRLNAVLVEADLHTHDRAVLDTVAAKLEPGPITREGQEAQLRAMIAAQTQPPETPA